MFSYSWNPKERLIFDLIGFKSKLYFLIQKSWHYFKLSKITHFFQCYLNMVLSRLKSAVLWVRFLTSLEIQSGFTAIFEIKSQDISRFSRPYFLKVESGWWSNVVFRFFEAKFPILNAFAVFSQYWLLFKFNHIISDIHKKFKYAILKKICIGKNIGK